MPLRRNPLALTLLLLVLAACAALAWNALARRAAAPPVGYTLLDGSRLQQQQLRGKVVLVNFWATSCTTCVGEMPQMVDTYRKFAPRGFALVAVAMQYDNPDFVRHYAAAGPQGRLPFSVALDSDGTLARDWGQVNLTPTSFLVDADGRIVKKFVGPPDFAQLDQLLQQLTSAKT